MNIGANNKIRIGMIGVNGRGKGMTSGLAKMSDCEIVCVCDVDSRAIEACQKLVYEITGRTPRAEKDLRRLCQADDVDAVVIATPDHWHVPAAIMAMKAGKHVYLEKPISHSPAENEIVLKAAEKYGVVVQAGNQRRSWPNVVAAIEEIKAGNIGKVRFAKGWYTNSRKSIGVGKNVPVPEWLDWELWQGPAPREEYRDNIIHYNWHWFKNWGTGEAMNNGMHFVDLLRWGLGVGYPTHVDSIGDRYFYNDDCEFPDTQLMSFQFGDECSFHMECRSCNSGPVEGLHMGVAFYGEKANLTISGGNTYVIRNHKGKVLKRVKSDLVFEEGNLMNPSEKLDAFHFANWFEAIRKGTPLNAPLKEACLSTQLVQYASIAQQVGHSLEVDPVTGKILHADRAVKRLWTRKYERGWEPELN